MPEMTGAQAICETFKAEGVKHLFMLPGSTEIPFLDALATHPEIKVVGATHESVAMAMADGYARASKSPGITLVHATPGTCYLMANLYNTKKIGVPLIMMAGESDSRITINEPLLTANVVEMTRHFTKWSWRIGTAAEIPRAMRRAFKVATTPPVGAVFLSIPQDLQAQQIDADIYPAQSYHIPMKIKPDPEQLRRAAELLASAERPTIITGNRTAYYGGVPQVAELAELVAARVYAELLPHSMNFPASHPLYMGALSYTEIEEVGRSSDVVLVVGCNVFDDVFYPEAAFGKDRGKVIHLDIDTWEIAKNHPLDVALVADIPSGLNELAAEVKERLNKPRQEAIRQRAENIKQSVAKTRAELREEFEKDADVTPIRIWRLMREFMDALPPDCVLVDKAMGYRNYSTKIFSFPQPDTYYSTSGALAWAMGAALGVQLALPEKRVVSLGGDGETMFSIQSLWTACNYNIPVVNVVVNNRSYMSVKSRLLYYKGEAAKRGILPGVDLEHVDFAKVAEGFGVRGYRVERPGELKATMEEALALGKPALIDVLVDTKDPGYHMPRIP